MAQPDGELDPKQHTPYRKILVTGGLGFVGSHVCRQLMGHGQERELVLLDRFSYAADHRRLDKLPGGGRPKLVRGDIRNDRDLVEAIEGCDAVVHLAAETHVSRSFADPSFFFDTNVNGTENLLKRALTSGVKHFVHVSSAAVYGSTRDKVDEDAPLKPLSPYAMSKALAEEAVMLAAQEGMRASILRPVNAVGVGQNPEKLVPRFFMQAMRNKPLTIEGSGFQERAFVPVSDLASAIDLVLNRETDENLAAFNVAGRDRLSILEIANTVFRALGHQGRTQFVEDRPLNEKYVSLEDHKIRALGYEQQGSLAAELSAIHADLLSRSWLQPGRS